MHDLRPPALDDLLRRLAALEYEPRSDTPIARLTAEFLRNNWANAQALLARAPRLQVRPQSPALRSFDFTLDVPFKRQRHPGGTIDVAPGPIRGRIAYRADVFAAADEPVVGVMIDPSLGLVHPNYSRLFGVLCLGHMPAGPMPLDRLLEHVYSILTYENVSSSDAADPGAAVYFANDPNARQGLPPAAPLWGDEP